MTRRRGPEAVVLTGMLALVAAGACAVLGRKDAREALIAREHLDEPIVIRSVQRTVSGRPMGILDATLEAVMDTVYPPGDSTPVILRAYNLVSANGRTYNLKGSPGPTFWVSPGDSVRIKLINSLPADPAMHSCVSYAARDTVPPRDTFPNCFHGPNTTNIHYHGFHVSPSGTADNVLLEIGPDSSFQYAFRIPMNQSPGTHWYHPHKHGAVALQVTNGMSGAFIIEGGGLDSLTRALRIQQHLIGVQQVDSQVNLVGTTKKQVKLINGRLNPVIVMRQNEVQRWRLVNENISSSTTYQVLFDTTDHRAKPKLYDVARDGVQYDPANYNAVQPDTNLIVAPGNRLDMFVQAPPDTGLHQLNAVLVGTQPGSRRQTPNLQALSAQTQALLRVLVIPNDNHAQTQLPQTLPPLPSFLNPLPAPPDTAISIVFSEVGKVGGGDPTNPPAFFLGRADSVQMKFNQSVPFIQMPLGATQTWKVTNLSQVLNHPFHIHINPFQVMFVSYQQSDGNAPLYAELNAAAQRGRPIWMDTFALPKGGYVVIRQRYDDFAGRFVMHCHILGHEERGMMQLVEVVR